MCGEKKAFCVWWEVKTRDSWGLELTDNSAALFTLLDT